MMCSGQELAIPSHMIPENKRDGIYILEEEYKLGTDIKEILGINDSLIEFEITSNRPDCLSIIGIAREAAVTLNEKVKYPTITVKESEEKINFKIEVQDDLCKRYTARIVKNIKIGPSPYWMQRRLIEANVRPINNIVDITNYVMLETGQPLHAFDMRDIEGNEIIVKRAQNDEKFTTLDEKERVLDNDILMINDGKKALAIAGIMGGANSEVKEDTTEILLESAAFNNDNIRLSSKRLGLRTEASSRFEKGIDINLTITAVNRAAQLIEEIGAGQVLCGIVDVYKEEAAPKKLVIKPQNINKRLGVDVPIADFIQILEDLEFKCNLIGEDLELEVPSFRLDVSEEADIFEEIARIYGYDKIPSKMIFAETTMGLKTIGQLFEEGIQNSLVAMGLNEILTYSFVSPKGVDKINLPSESIKRKFIKLINPLGEETSAMRTTLLPNMLEVISRNNARKVEEFSGFEIGNTFLPLDDIMPVEKKCIAIGLYGKSDFFSLKGIVEELFRNLGFENYEIVPEKNHPSFHPGRCANIVYGSNILGVMGEIHPVVIDNYDLNKRVYMAEIDFDLLLTYSNDAKTYKPLPKYPAMTRDVALVVKDEVFVKEIEDVIKANSNGLVESFKLFDVYKGSQIEEGHKSVAYSIVYRSEDKTLTDEEVTQVHTKIVDELCLKFDTTLRL